MADLDILGIAQLGTKLSSSLDLHVETCRKARTKGIPKLVSLVNSTSTTLQQVYELSQQAHHAFSEVCINDINGLAATCRALYEGTLVLLVEREKHNDQDREIGNMKQEQVETLLSSLAAKTNPGYETWEWLEPRLKICQGELRRVKFELMLRFLLGSIAQFQLRFVLPCDTPLVEDAKRSFPALQRVLRAIGRVNDRCDLLLRTLLNDASHTTRNTSRSGNSGQRKMFRHLRLQSLSEKREVWLQTQGKVFYQWCMISFSDTVLVLLLSHRRLCRSRL